MPDSLRQSRNYSDHKIAHAWKSLPEGWRELLCQSNSALTYFYSNYEDEQTRNQKQSNSLHWSLLAAEIEETDKELLVRIEIPGLEKKDCHLTLQNNKLSLTGIKHLENQDAKRICHVSERAYGSFQRSIFLPKIIDQYKARAIYRNGVLTVILPKIDCNPPVAIQVS